MKTVLWRFLIIALPLTFLNADSCGPERDKARAQQALLAAKIHKVEGDLEKNEMSAQMKLAFERKAEQKLQDFFDYATIVADKSLDVAFRENAQDILKSLIRNEQIELLDPLNVRGELSLDDFNTRLFKSNLDRVEFRIDSIHVAQSLDKKQDDLYQGRIDCILRSTTITNGDTILNRSPITCDFYVVKDSSTIGGTIMLTWKSVLGEIRSGVTDF